MDVQQLWIDSPQCEPDLDHLGAVLQEAMELVQGEGEREGWGEGAWSEIWA
jgi:hypothetical protein